MENFYELPSIQLKCNFLIWMFFYVSAAVVSGSSVRTEFLLMAGVGISVAQRYVAGLFVAGG